MDMFPALYADIHNPDQRPQVIAQLRDRGLVTFSGIYDRAGLKAAARQSCASGQRPNPGVTRIACPPVRSRLRTRMTLRLFSVTCPSGNVPSSSTSTTRPETPRMIRSATGNCSGCCTPGG
jgi:hypothetical protein